MPENKPKQVSMPIIVFPLTLTLEDAIIEYYSIPGNECGGNCHIVLDDYNVRDCDLKECLDVCEKKGDWLGARIMEGLAFFNEGDRKKAMDGEYPVEHSMTFKHTVVEEDITSDSPVKVVGFEEAEDARILNEFKDR